jgi:hypothetical protein
MFYVVSPEVVADKHAYDYLSTDSHAIFLSSLKQDAEVEATTTPVTKDIVTSLAT